MFAARRQTAILVSTAVFGAVGCAGVASGPADDDVAPVASVQARPAGATPVRPVAPSASATVGSYAPAPMVGPAAAPERAAARAWRRFTAVLDGRGQPVADRGPGALTARWRTISLIGGLPAMWIAERSGVTLIRFDQGLVHLALHAGSSYPGGTGWRHGPAVTGAELHHLVLGFNGGFKFSTGSGGFMSFGRTPVPLVAGLGSIVTYRDGTTAIGAWRREVPARGRPIASVRQNLSPLIDHGRANPSVSNCGAGCWGATIGPADVARSALGIRRDGQLVWAGGEGLSVAQLARALLSVGVQRAVQLDINPDWVAAYLYVHHRSSAPTPVPLVPGQRGISGQLLSPYFRDFFTVVAN